jgi:hypothetical protein
METFLVGVIVTAATAYAVWALLPPMTRLKVARRLARWSGGSHSTPGWLQRVTSRLETKASAAPPDCANCGTDHAAKLREKPPGDA